MLDIYFPPTPNGYKLAIFCEEAGLPYQLIRRALGENFTKSFLEISPNNKLPVITDNEPTDGNGPISVFESGAILVYLAEKTGTFLSTELRPRIETFEWLFWQVGGLGPISGQRTHFHRAAPEKLPYPKERFARELGRLYAVLDHRLENRDFVAGDYSIADMAIYPWIVAHGLMEIDLDQFSSVKRWHAAISERPAVKRAYEAGKLSKPATPNPDYTKEQEWILHFGQTSDLLRRAYAGRALFD